jgi:hypothetical protein
MVDLNMPEDLDPEQRQRWLEQTGAALVEETGDTSGQITYTKPDGQKAWVMWWPKEQNPD